MSSRITDSTVDIYGELRETPAPDPVPSYPEEVLMVLGMLATKARVWRQRRQTAECDAYLAGRVPGEHNPLRKRRRYYPYHEAIAEAATAVSRLDKSQHWEPSAEHEQWKRDTLGGAS